MSVLGYGFATPPGAAERLVPQTGVPVIYVRVAFRGGTPEISPNNRTFSALARSGASARPTWR